MYRFDVLIRVPWCEHWIDVNTVMRLTYTCTHAAGIRLFQKQGAFRFTAFVNYIFTDKSNQRFDLAVN
jgi:hypothetical protein